MSQYKTKEKAIEYITSLLSHGNNEWVIFIGDSIEPAGFVDNKFMLECIIDLKTDN